MFAGEVVCVVTIYTLMSQVDNSIHAYGYSLEWNSKVTIGGLRWDRYDFDVLSGLSRKLYLAGLGGGVHSPTGM